MQPPEKQQLFKSTQLLEDAKKLAEVKVENDDILAMVFQRDGELVQRQAVVLPHFIATLQHHLCSKCVRFGHAGAKKRFSLFSLSLLP